MIHAKLRNTIPFLPADNPKPGLCVEPRIKNTSNSIQFAGKREVSTGKD